jgi:DNA-directed RNA polymerase subunit L
VVDVLAENAHSYQASHPYNEAMQPAIGLWSNVIPGAMIRRAARHQLRASSSLEQQDQAVKALAAQGTGEF